MEWTRFLTHLVCISSELGIIQTERTLFGDGDEQQIFWEYQPVVGIFFEHIDFEFDFFFFVFCDCHHLDGGQLACACVPPLQNESQCWQTNKTDQHITNKN